MTCVTMNSYTRTCGGVSGGVSAIYIFDPSDFDFTQTTAGAPYTVVALRPGATVLLGAKMFSVSFQNKEADYTAKQSTKGCSVKYVHELKAMLPQLSNNLTNFMTMLDQAGCCCGIGLIIQMNDGKTFVVGEKFVNATPIVKWQMQQNGSEGGSGKVFDDENGMTIAITGDFNRGAYELSGGIALLSAFL